MNKQKKIKVEKIIADKPFLKFPGNKHKIIGDIKRLIGKGKGKRLVEPFVGSGAVFMGTDFDSYLLCDTNKDLIGLFNNLKNYPQATIKETKKYFSPSYNTPDEYYRLRTMFNTLGDEVIEKSALFVYLNRHSFNGLCRYNSKGEFNVPFGKYACPKAPVVQMELFAIKAQKATFEVLDFKDCLKQVNKDDVVYCDPPYVPISITSNFTSYSDKIFSLSDHDRLAKELNHLSTQGIKIILSNSDTEFSRNLYPLAKFENIEVRRTISCKANGRNMAKEILAVL
jgi:DNA adenine methylase